MLKRLMLLLVLVFLPVPLFAGTFVVGEVVIDGNRRVEQSSIRAVLAIRPGDAVSEAEVDRDLAAIYKLGRFSDVTAEVQERNGAKILVYHVSERPLVREVKFIGNEEFKEEKLKTLVSLKPPHIFDPKLVSQSIAAIKAEYVKEGYYAAKIESKMDTDAEQEATLSFDIAEGDKVLIDEIRFVGNNALSDRQLKKAMETKERWFLSWITGRGAYDEEILKIDMERITDQYFNQGYVQAKVKYPEISLVDEGRYMVLTIEIEEGDQFHVGSIDASGDLIKPKDEILALTKLKTGDVFSRQALRTDVTTINDLYADAGYAYVNVAPLSSIDADARTVALKYDIEQGIQVTIDQIRIGGNTKTRDKVIRREMKLAEGDLFSATKIKESRRRVNNLGFFEEVNIATSKSADEAHMNLDVDVKERPTGTFSLGFGYSSVDSFIAQGSITQNNFLGKGLKLNLSGSLGGTSSTYQIGLTDPYFLDKNLTLGFDLYKTEREWSDWSRRATGGDIKLGFPVYDDDTRMSFIYRYEQKEIFDVESTASSLIKDQEGSSTLSSVTGSVTRDTTDYRLDPSRGYVSELSGELAGLGGTEHFAKGIADHRHFFPLFWSTVFSLHGQMGYARGWNNEEVPLDERFWLGGIRTLRGFDSRKVGPQAENGDYIGGVKEAYFNAEYIFPLIKDIGMKGVLFYDTGNAWGSEQWFNDMRQSVGGGIRWYSPMGPLRLEWGYNLDPKETEKQSRFEFAIGNVF